MFDESSILKISAESISKAEQEDFDKHVELQKVQSDYPRSTDLVPGSNRSTPVTGSSDRRDRIYQSMFVNT